MLRKFQQNQPQCIKDKRTLGGRKGRKSLHLQYFAGINFKGLAQKEK